jgi:trk system potassium uptake protein TrkH
MAGISRFVKKVLLGTFIIEGIGALAYMLVFIPEFGVRGIWISVFNSVSAFCNAGIDVIGENSLCNYATNPFVNTITALLIILGGIGYIVWWDVLRVFKERSGKKKRLFRHLTLHSKIAIVSSLILLLCGGVLIFIFEYSNPQTIGEMSLIDKLQVSFFQSVTTRTAGFLTIPQENLTDASSAVSLILMAIGGSPVGTAGGMKTVTVAVLLFSALAAVRNKRNATVFGRCISAESIRKAVAVSVMFMVICFGATVILLATNDLPLIDALYETVSASATVGLSRNITSSLNVVGKLIIIITMYLGRVGPISLAVAIGSKSESQNVISEPLEEINIG